MIRRQTDVDPNHDSTFSLEGATIFEASLPPPSLPFATLCGYNETKHSQAKELSRLDPSHDI